MLVLTRYPGQKIIIGSGKDAIHVRILSNQGKKVTIGITAPRDIPVHREEIHQRIFPTDKK